MAKSGTPRHSKPARKPVTINLDPSDVKRVDEAAKPQATNQAMVQATPAAEPVGDFSKMTDPKPAATATPKFEPKAEKPPLRLVLSLKPQGKRRAPPRLYRRYLKRNPVQAALICWRALPVA